jgi:predicted HTH transcriptional regulator
MDLQDIKQGESKNVEFKVELPKKSEKYMKTVIAFANSSGGKIVIGVDDESREVVGVDDKEVFRIMDSIANAVSDSCTPQIVPNITFQAIEDKCVVVVQIYPGTSRPYFLKNVGKHDGTYIRVAGTSRLADDVKIKELEIEGLNLSWDELTCVGYKVTDEAVSRLCFDIRKYMLESASSNDEKQTIREVTKQHLLNWKVLKQLEGDVVATNAFVLLTDDYFRFSKIQCALFKGKERDIFIDKKEYTGALYVQIEEAYKFVLKHINLSAKIEGLVRKEAYELPISAIREMIINAVCHRNYMDDSCVQVAIFDDRVEVTSPGMLYHGLTLEEAMNGRSKIRNRAIAEVFNRMEIIESWGTGIKRIVERAKEYNLPKPEFLEMGETFRVNLYRPKTPPNVHFNIRKAASKKNSSKKRMKHNIVSLLSHRYSQKT